MLENIVERGYPCFVPEFSGKASSFFPLIMALSVGFLQMFFIMLRIFSSIPSLLRGFLKKSLMDDIFV